MTNTVGAAENINYRTGKNFKDDSLCTSSRLITAEHEGATA